MVTDESPLSFLFRPEEVEQLVCGSKVGIYWITELEYFYFNENFLEFPNSLFGGLATELS